MSEFKKYYTARSNVFMRPYEPGEEVRWVDKVHVSPRDGATGSPKAGDYIAFSPEKPDQQYLVSAENFKSYEAAGEGETISRKDVDGDQGDTAPMVRDPLKAAEMREQQAAEAKAEGDTEAAEEAEKPTEAGTITGSQKTVETAKPEGEASKAEPKKEEPKEAPKFPTKK